MESVGVHVSAKSLRWNVTLRQIVADGLRDFAGFLAGLFEISGELVEPFDGLGGNDVRLGATLGSPFGCT